MLLQKKFPSPYGVLFILIVFIDNPNNLGYEIVSVSLRSIIHSYQVINKNDEKIEIVKFPSPYGVLFILIWIIYVIMLVY